MDIDQSTNNDSTSPCNAGSVPNVVVSNDNRPQKKRRLEQIQLVSEGQPVPAKAFICSDKMKAVFSQIHEEIDNRAKLQMGTPVFDMESFPDLTSKELAAMSGHMLGAISTFTPEGFE